MLFAYSVEPNLYIHFSSWIEKYRESIVPYKSYHLPIKPFLWKGTTVEFVRLIKVYDAINGGRYSQISSIHFGNLYDDLPTHDERDNIWDMIYLDSSINPGDIYSEY